MSTPYPGQITAETGLNSNNNADAKSLYDQTEGRQVGAHIAFPGTPDVLQSGITDPNWEYGSTNNSLRAAITDYIRMRLGDGIVDVELEKEHYEMSINQALIKYRQRSQNAVEESYISLKLLPETQEYIMPKEIQTIRACYRRGIGSTSTNQFEPFSSGFLNTYMLVAGRVGGLTNYELFVDYQKLTMKMFGGYIVYTFNPTTKKLVINRKMPFQGGNPDLEQQESVLLWVYNTKPDQMLFNDTYAFPWLQEYAYSFSKRIIGEARSKFSAIAGPQGGATLNGDALKQEALAEMDKLEQELKDYVDGGQPMTWVTG